MSWKVTVVEKKEHVFLKIGFNLKCYANSNPLPISILFVVSYLLSNRFKEEEIEITFVYSKKWSQFTVVLRKEIKRFSSSFEVI